MLKNYLFFVYSFFATGLEQLFFKKFSSTRHDQLSNLGYETCTLNEDINVNLKDAKTILINPYLSKVKLSSKQIKKLIDDIFISNKVYKLLRARTGFNFCISHITAYEIRHIPDNKSHLNFYANLWHKDGPYSKNTLKIVLPIEDIFSENGPINIYPKYLSNQIPFYKFKYRGQLNSYFEFEGKKYSKTLIFNPHICFHRAGNPKPNLTRRQIVFQINPAPEWCFCKNIYDTQLDMEPKFPLLNYKLYEVEKLKIPSN